MKARRIDSLTGIRFLAALWVLLFHYTAWHLIELPAPLAAFVAQGRAGVSLFFILSGFILYHTYHAEFQNRVSGARFRAFIRARLARVYPLHVLTLLLITPFTLWYVWTESAGAKVWFGVIPTPSLLASSWFANLLLLHVYHPTLPFEELWNGPSWSIANEMVFYLLFPAFAALILSRIHRTKVLLRLATVLFVLEVAGFVAMLELAINVHWTTIDFLIRLPIARVWEFFLGCTLAAVRVRWQSAPARRLSTPGRHLTLALTLAGIVGVAMLPSSGVIDLMRWYVLYTPLFGLLILTLGSGATFLTPVLACPPIVLLGEASFALYLTQAIGGEFLARLSLLGYPVGTGTYWPILAIAATVTASMILYRYFESPVRRALREPLRREPQLVALGSRPAPVMLSGAGS